MEAAVSGEGVSNRHQVPEFPHFYSHFSFSIFIFVFVFVSGFTKRNGIFDTTQDGGGKIRVALTMSKPPPTNTRSLVAAMLPPFRCRSQAMALRSSWGNMAAICSTCWTLMVRCRELAGTAVPVLAEGEGARKKKWRMRKAVRRRMRPSWGREMEVVSGILFVAVGLLLR